jgi:bla regulator protein blaR1
MRANRSGYRNRAVAAIGGIAAIVSLAVMSVMSAPATHAVSQTQNAAAAETDAGAKYEYDVVSIKILDPDLRGVDIGTGYAADGLTAHGVRMFWMFRNAYGVTKPEIVGAPAWFDDVRFSIDARLDPATSAELQKLSPDRLKAVRMQMLQAVLAERFGLKFHYETRELPAYFLTVAKGGPKLQEARPDFVGKLDLNDINGKRYTDFVTIEFEEQNTLVGQAASMKTLTEFLSQWALSLSGENAKPVLDKTGLIGAYDFAVKFSPQAMLVAPSGADPAGNQPQADMQNPGGPNLFKALQDSLGLKMEAGKGPVRVIVIDHVEKPSAN